MTKDFLKETLFCDIETVTQKSSYDELDSQWKKLWDDQVFRDEDVKALSPAERYQLKANLRAEFGTIVCVSLGAVMFDAQDVPTLYVKSLTGDEKDILTKFSSATTKYKRLAAHNGKGFDFGYLSRRFLINGMKIPNVLNTQGKKPWEIENIDTQELWRFGDLAFPSLELLASVLNIDVGNSVDGSEINKGYYDGSLTVEQIAEKCAKDVAATARVFVKLNDPTLDINNVTFA